MTEVSPWLALGAELADARHRTSHSQHHLARHLGISQAAYSQIERGVVRPRPLLLGQLAVALGADVGRLAALAGHPLTLVLPVVQLGSPPRSRPLELQHRV